MQNLLLKTLILTAVALPGLAISAPIDVADAVTQIGTDGSAAITAIGVVVITLAALAMVYKWVKGTIFS